jgi:hypothetical protein
MGDDSRSKGRTGSEVDYMGDLGQKLPGDHSVRQAPRIPSAATDLSTSAADIMD